MIESINNNFKITIQKEIIYKEEKIFENYVLDLYKKKNESKLKNEKILESFYKLLLNSLYGKFG